MGLLELPNDSADQWNNAIARKGKAGAALAILLYYHLHGTQEYDIILSLLIYISFISSRGFSLYDKNEESRFYFITSAREKRSERDFAGLQSQKYQRSPYLFYSADILTVRGYFRIWKFSEFRRSLLLQSD